MMESEKPYSIVIQENSSYGNMVISCRGPCTRDRIFKTYALKYLDFLPVDDQPNRLTVVCSSFNDILLVSRGDTTFYLCNPATKQWILLPEAPPIDDGNGQLNRYALSARKSDKDCYEYRVSVIYYSKDLRLTSASIFSSESGEWRKSLVTPPWPSTVVAPHFDQFPYTNVDPNGIVYWIEREDERGVVALNPFADPITTQVWRFIDTPQDMAVPRRGNFSMKMFQGQPWLIKSGRLPNYYFKTWELVIVDDAAYEWRSVHDKSEVKRGDLARLVGRVGCTFSFVLHPSNSDVIFSYSFVDGSCFRHNIVTGSIREFNPKITSSEAREEGDNDDEIISLDPYNIPDFTLFPSMFFLPRLSVPTPLPNLPSTC